MVQLLTDREQLLLGTIATKIHIAPRATVYRQDSLAEWIFIVDHGVAKSFRELPSGRQQVMNFLFPGDLFGLAERGVYVNTVRAITPLTAYRIRLDALSNEFRRNTGLEAQLLRKITHELRESQRRTVVFSRHDAIGRVAMFLHMLEARQEGEGPTIDVPMSRTDIGRYVGLSLEAVSRATAKLARDGILEFPTLHTARVVDRKRFDRLVEDV